MKKRSLHQVQKKPKRKRGSEEGNIDLDPILHEIMERQVKYCLDQIIPTCQYAECEERGVHKHHYQAHDSNHLEVELLCAEHLEKRRREEMRTKKLAIAFEIFGEDSERPDYRWLRAMAEMLYTTSESGISLRVLSDDELFKGRVSQRTIRRWCRKHGWVQKRTEHLERLG